ncbi:alpha/beta fold hydrolase [Natrialbaceae archaeon GCM10025810]|uniref:alpha/beta fold hydrolase n=1 Tax=Halovalidus salilacus TaxID=3075124 RepID=UPI0036173CE1
MPPDYAASDEQSGVVSIHGTGLDAWIWDEMTPALEVPHLPVTFPDRNGDREGRGGLGLPDYVDHVCRQIAEWPPTELVVVAHSIGGVIGKEVARVLADRAVGFVGVCATIPEPGGSFLSCYPFPQRLIQRVVMRVAGTKPPDGVVRKSLCNGLSEPQADRIVEQFRPESQKLYTDTSLADVPDVPSLYVKTLDDDELSPALQETMVANLQPRAVVTIDSGHMPMLSHPNHLAASVNEFTAE